VQREKWIHVGTAINTAIISPGGGNVGIGFAVPINMARRVMEQLVQYGEVRRGQIGISIRDLGADLAPKESYQGGNEQRRNRLFQFNLGLN
jgi:S1-C subfamily serine protease